MSSRYAQPGRARKINEQWICSGLAVVQWTCSRLADARCKNQPKKSRPPGVGSKAKRKGRKRKPRLEPLSWAEDEGETRCVWFRYRGVFVGRRRGRGGQEKRRGRGCEFGEYGTWRELSIFFPLSEALLSLSSWSQVATVRMGKV